jgi:hypothetical protein
MKPTKTTIPLRDQCLSHCATLRIPLKGASLDELLSKAEKEGLSHLHFLDLLLGTQADAGRECAVARRWPGIGSPRASPSPRSNPVNVGRRPERPLPSNTTRSNSGRTWANSQRSTWWWIARGGLDLAAAPQDAAAAADCVVIMADHFSLDYQAVVNERALIVDSRNALKAFRSEKIVRL